MIVLRQSSLNSFETCAYLCMKEWGVIGQDPPREEDVRHTNKYADVGIVFHEVMEHWAQNKVKGISVELITLHDMLTEKFKTIPHELFKDEEDITKYFNSIHEQLDWCYERSYMITPISTELKFEIPDMFVGLPSVTGSIDRIDGDLSTRDVDIVDYKTGKVYTKRELIDNIQAYVYSEAFYRIHGFYPKRFIFMFTKWKKIKIIYINPEFLALGNSRVLAICAKMQQGMFEPSCINKYFCNHFCPKEVKDDCPRMGKNKKGWSNIGYESFEPEE